MAGPRRILLLITDLQIGGTPTVVRELAVRLRAAGNAHVEVACLAPRGPVADELAAAGVAVTALGASSVVQAIDVVRKLVRLIDRQGIDTVLSFLVHANAIAAAASLFRPDVRWLQSIQTTQPYPRWHWWVQRVASLAAQRIVVPSPSVARVAAGWADVAVNKIAVIPNAVDSDLSAWHGLPARGLRSAADVGHRPIKSTGEPPVPRTDTGWKPVPQADADTGWKPVPRADTDTGWKPVPLQRGGIGFVGRLDPIKRVTDLVDAVALLGQDVRLHIYGDGPERGAIEARVAQHGLAARVTMHGAIPDAKPAIASLDVLVLPSEAEGFGLVLIEAMAAGVPVVATNAPGIRDVVTDGVTGLLVPVGRPDALAAAIARILADPALRSSLVMAAADHVRRNYSWDVVLPRYRQLLHL